MKVVVLSKFVTMDGEPSAPGYFVPSAPCARTIDCLNATSSLSQIPRLKFFFFFWNAPEYITFETVAGD